MYLSYSNINFIAPIAVAAEDKDAKTLFNSSLNETAGETGHIGIKMSNAGALGAVGLVISVALSLLGVVFLILMIYGGFVWMNSRGNEQDVEKAKNIIRNSIVGLLIVVAAYGITVFIGGNLAAWVTKSSA